MSQVFSLEGLYLEFKKQSDSAIDMQTFTCSNASKFQDIQTLANNLCPDQTASERGSDRDFTVWSTSFEHLKILL